MADELILGWRQTAPGATLRSITEKLREGNFDPRDFGASGDGVSAAADQTGFQNAIRAAMATTSYISGGYSS
jgi:hypothetical protein